MKWSSITVPLLFVSCHTFKVKRKKNIYERHSKWIMWLAFVDSHLIWMSFKNCSELKYGVRKKSVYSCYWMIEKVIHSSFSINLNENIMFNQLRQHLCNYYHSSGNLYQIPFLSWTLNWSFNSIFASIFILLTTFISRRNRFKVCIITISVNFALLKVCLH